MDKKKIAFLATGTIAVLLLVAFLMSSTGVLMSKEDRAMRGVNDKNIEIVDEGVTHATSEDASLQGQKANDGNAEEKESDSGALTSDGGSNENESTESSGGSEGGNGSSSGGGSSAPGGVTYADYIAMTPAQQQAYFESFSSLDAYTKWYNDAKAEYEANNESIEIEGGNVNLGDIVNGNK